MKTEVHTFKLNLDWELIRHISQIDRFDASWTTIEKKEGQSLKQLKSSFSNLSAALRTIIALLAVV
jgi:hypothetical protein